MRKQPGRRRWRIVPALFVAMLATGVARGDEIQVAGATTPRPFLLASGGDGAIDEELEASAVEPIGDGRLILVAHDKAEGLVVAESATGRIVGPPLTCGRFPKGLKFGPKWEAMATDDEGWFYVCGSHSGKTAEERADHSYLLRFRLRGDGSAGNPPAIDEGSVTRWHVAGGLAKALAAEGLDRRAVANLKVEGLAVRTLRDAAGAVTRRELVIGLREPDDRSRGFVADITTPPGPDADLPATRLFAFDAGRREGVPSQISSLLYLPEWRGFLAITSSEDDHNVFHGNTLWFLADADLARPRQVCVFEVAMKAEGLCLLPDGAAPARVLVVFDNDAKKTRMPSRFQVLTLATRPR